jgi:predicted DNA-binding protein (MmcQ/YjbR family)
VTEHFPFDQDTLVLKWGQNVYLSSLKKSGESAVEFKMRDRAQELRAQYED